PADLAPVLARQLAQPPFQGEAPVNFGGGLENSMSLAQLTEWCAGRFGAHSISSDPTPRPFDIPWMVMDCGAAAKRWGWKPQRRASSVLEEIARHAEQHPNWLDLTAA